MRYVQWLFPLWRTRASRWLRPPGAGLRGRRGGDAPTSRANRRWSRAGERLVHRIEALVEEIARLRADNDELHQQVAMRSRCSTALRPRWATRGRGAAGVQSRAPSRGGAARRRRPRSRAAKGRATPPEVTTEVVRAVIAKLGQGTAAEIASEITKAGVKVSAGPSASWPSEPAPRPPGATTASAATASRTVDPGSGAVTQATHGAAAGASSRAHLR